MAYAAYADVAARAGRFASIFEITGKHPDATDVTAILNGLSAEIDAALLSHGFDPAGISSSVKAGLLDLTAYGALARALLAANPGPEASPLLTLASQIWEEGIAGIIAGTYPALAELLAGAGGVPASVGGDFFDDEPNYEQNEFNLSLTMLRSNIGFEMPWRRGQSL